MTSLQQQRIPFDTCQASESGQCKSHDPYGRIPQIDSVNERSETASKLYSRAISANGIEGVGSRPLMKLSHQTPGCCTDISYLNSFGSLVVDLDQGHCRSRKKSL